jgi:2-dehydro-3-deoxygluconokinase
VAPTTSSDATEPYDLITLGETMWRLSAPGHTRLDVTATLEVNVGGAESNLAIALARLGKRVAWWSRLPDNPLGQHIAQTLRTFGVDVSGIYWQKDARLGTYFIEFGSAPRPTQVVYDRANSAASQMQPGDFDWSVFGRTRRLHLTGITPALSASCLETVRTAIREANNAGVPVSFDLNYRAKLWSWDECRPVMDELASQCQMVIGATRDAQNLVSDTIEGEPLVRRLHERWQGATVILTKGAEGPVAFDGTDFYHVPAFTGVQIVDRIGAGDAFDAGLLCALLDGKTLPEAMRYGNAVAALKMTMFGDIALVRRDEVEALLAEESTDIRR